MRLSVTTRTIYYLNPPYHRQSQEALEPASKGYRMSTYVLMPSQCLRGMGHEQEQRAANPRPFRHGRVFRQHIRPATITCTRTYIHVCNQHVHETTIEKEEAFDSSLSVIRAHPCGPFKCRHNPTQPQAARPSIYLRYIPDVPDGQAYQTPANPNHPKI